MTDLCSMLSVFDRVDVLKEILCSDLSDSSLDQARRDWSKAVQAWAAQSPSNENLQNIVEEWTRVLALVNQFWSNTLKLDVTFHTELNLDDLSMVVAKHHSFFPKLKALDPDRKFFITRAVFEKTHEFQKSDENDDNGGYTILTYVIERNHAEGFNCLLEHFKIDPKAGLRAFRQARTSKLRKECIKTWAAYLARSNHSTEAVADLLSFLLERHSCNLFNTDTTASWSLDSDKMEKLIRVTHSLTDINITDHTKTTKKSFRIPLLPNLILDCENTQHANKFLRFVKLCVEVGVDFDRIKVDSKSETMLGKMVSNLAATALPAIRYLALEKGLNVQHFDPNFIMRDGPKKRALKAFGDIKNEQRILTNGNSLE
ncbi:hypothetical protein HDU97_007342 [Phlyctochytrium planicorne]|nr:hypothetical protein HDU97_007342 [Phlyctochytrium planicorne]